MKQIHIVKLRNFAQHYTPALLGVYASGWRRYFERRKAYRSSNKIKVLMGPAWQATKLDNPKFYLLDPLLSVERQVGLRGWHIDPIVDYVNSHSNQFVCDTFMHETELLSRAPDIVFVCKNFDDISLTTIKVLRKKGVKLIYSIVDNSRFQKKCYLEHPEYLQLFNHIIIASPVQEQDVSSFAIPYTYLPTPAVNTKFKTNYDQSAALRLVWNGFKQNLKPMQALFPIVNEVSEQINIPIEIVLNTNLPESHQDGVHTIPWSIESWEDVMVASDIAVVIKPLDDIWQKRKPPTKVITYMAAGLPTICTPTKADETIIQHGVTAYAVSSEPDWKRFLIELGTSVEKRKQMGQSARKSVMSKCSIEKIANEHELIFQSILEKPHK